MERARGIPVLVGQQGDRLQLERIQLGKGMHNENWLQELIHDQPSILPVAEIEPGFGEVFALAREVPCGQGTIDNLYLTPSGDIVLVETKLWHNSQMRREVVAQALDYVSALTAMSYEQFEQATARGLGAGKQLYALVADHPEALTEPDFIDAVSNNLRRGRMLVMVVGDGIRTETEALAGLLQSHAGAHFTFALVEIATWLSADGGILAIPDILTRTVMIERGIVRVEGTGVAIEPVRTETSQRAHSISMGDFLERMSQRNRSLPASINALLDALEPLGVYPELKASLNLKVDVPDLDRPANFGYIDKHGKFWTSTASWNLPERVWRPYYETVASLIGGHIIDEPNNHFVAITGRSAPRIEDLLPRHTDALVAAIGEAVRKLRADAG